MAEYLFEMCKADGTTPLGKCPVYTIEAPDYQHAKAKAHREHPDHEVVSWGRKDEIEAMRAKFS